MEDGCRVLYPTIFPELQKHFPDILFIDKDFVNINYEDAHMREKGSVTVLPLRFADKIIRASYKNCMAAKYRILGYPASMWRNLYWERDMESEKTLFYDILKLKDDTKYNLINKTFLSDFSKTIDIRVDNSNLNVIMTKNPGFSLLDWGMVIENAYTIHTVSTSLLYVLEIMPLQAKEIHLYKRKGFEDHHEYYDYLLTKNYVLH